MRPENRFEGRYKKLGVIVNIASVCAGLAGHRRRQQAVSARCGHKALHDEPLPLFAAATDREQKSIAEQAEPEFELQQMTKGHTL
jgi:hypothetical protein